MMGIGWKSINGTWEETKKYALSKMTIKLLERIRDDSLINSVRDYHTKKVINIYGNKNVLMTGCPATYDKNYFDKGILLPSFKKLSFSLGVSFVTSKQMLIQMKQIILKLNNFCNKNRIKFEVVFHHSTKNSTNESQSELQIKMHSKFLNWIEINKINWVDISGSAENLINYYTGTDIHIGYRVHAHIFMNSISKPSILIAEDGRGKALKDVFGGIVINAFSTLKNNFLYKFLRKVDRNDRYNGCEDIPKDILEVLAYQLDNNLVQITPSRITINNNYTIMKRFLQQLP